MTYVWFFLAGAFAAYGVPHFVKGVLGEAHMSVTGAPMSAVMNVVFGTVSFALAWLLWRYAMNNASTHSYRYHIALGLGVLVAGVFLARTWSGKKPAAR